MTQSSFHLSKKKTTKIRIYESKDKYIISHTFDVGGIINGGE